MQSATSNYFIEHEEFLKNFDGSNWFIFRRDFCKIMEIEEAVFFQDLLNRCCMSWIEKTPDGFFQCSRGFLQQGTMKWSERVQKRLLASLKEKRLLRTEMRGDPTKRWIFLDLERVKRELSRRGQKRPDIEGGGDRNVPTGGDRNVPLINTIENNKHLLPADDGRKNGSDLSFNGNGKKEDPSYTLSSLLYNQLAKRGKLETRRPGEVVISEWKRDFRKLLEDYNFEEIKTVIPIHCENTRDGDYWPFATVAKMFRQKYSNIRAAYEREYGEIKPKKITIHVEEGNQFIDRVVDSNSDVETIRKEMVDRLHQSILHQHQQKASRNGALK